MSATQDGRTSAGNRRHLTPRRARSSSTESSKLATFRHLLTDLQGSDGTRSANCCVVPCVPSTARRWHTAHPNADMTRYNLETLHGTGAAVTTARSGLMTAVSRRLLVLGVAT